MNTDNNSRQNFSLSGFTSIQIGVYILIAAFAIKTLLNDFLGTNILQISSTKNVVILISTIVFFTLLFSFFALLFKGKKNAKKQQYKLWNKKAISSFWIIFISFLIIYGLLILAYNKDFIDFITPTFLFLYGFLLFAFHHKERKNLLNITGICFFFAIICFLIPNYWNSSFVILGVAHITYGVVVKS
jgi:drug/metabolite transporter (DMT)-like permease